MKDEQSLPMATPRNLGYIGLLPFFVGATAPWIFPEALQWFTRALMWYSLAIFSFQSGSIWGIVLQRPVPARKIHLVVAKCLLLLGWSTMFLPPVYGLGMLIVCYIALYQWERHTHLKYALGPDYLELRQQLTWPAIACHMLALFNVMRALQ